MPRRDGANGRSEEVIRSRQSADPTGHHNLPTRARSSVVYLEVATAALVGFLLSTKDQL